MITFLKQHEIGEEYSDQIVDELFNDIEIDQNSRVHLTDLANKYIELKNKLLEREKEVCQNIFTNTTLLKKAEWELI